MDRIKTSQFAHTPFSKHIALVAFAIIGLSLTGCSNQMAIMQENQANLQTLVQENARQMSDVVTCIKQSQKELQVTILNLRDTTQKLSDDMTLVTSAQTALQQTVQQKNAVIAKRVDSVEQSQKALSSELFNTAEERQKLAASIVNEEDKRIALEQVVDDNRTVFLAKVSSVQGSQVELQTELRSLKATIQTAVADISAVTQAQKTLEETVNTAMTGQLASLQQAQLEQQTQLEHSQGQIEKLLTGLSGLENNLTQLERILKEDIANVSKAVELAGHRQESYESTASQQAQGMASTVESVQHGQRDLTDQVVELQSATQSMIDTLKTDLQQVRDVVDEIKTLDIDTLEALASGEPAP
ncbi:MAG: hypothetical protein K9N55_04950 [Phycisphaerae bacterium]|nr:hypothetical protein [Phycisphaerae bacterium]